MNYRHSYHAGLFADVFKHVILISLIQTLQRKDKPLFYLDTHSGIGEYDLSAESQKTQEFHGGILKLWEAKKSIVMPSLLSIYLKIVNEWNLERGSEQLRFYPGSPCIVRKFLRSNDNMILTELHKEDIIFLQKIFKGDKQVAVHHLDGYQALKAFLPPKIGRGLVLIDPSFERKDEFELIVSNLKIAVNRWNTGIFAVWYPIKTTLQINSFYHKLQASGIKEILCCELKIPANDATSLNACGMIIIRPPWQWEKEVKSAINTLCHLLSSPSEGEFRIHWLVPEI